MDAIKQGKVTEDIVRKRVAPLFYTRMRLGEFDPPAMNPFTQLSNADVENPAHEKLVVEAAMKSYVLLKNDGLLPFKGKLKTIGVITCLSCIVFHYVYIVFQHDVVLFVFDPY